jgi:hypothetical protein
MKQLDNLLFSEGNNGDTGRVDTSRSNCDQFNQCESADWWYWPTKFKPRVSTMHWSVFISWLLNPLVVLSRRIELCLSVLTLLNRLPWIVKVNQWVLAWACLKSFHSDVHAPNFIVITMEWLTFSWPSTFC